MVLNNMLISIEHGKLGWNSVGLKLMVLTMMEEAKMMRNFKKIIPISNTEHALLGQRVPPLSFIRIYGTSV